MVAIVASLAVAVAGVLAESLFTTDIVAVCWMAGGIAAAVVRVAVVALLDSLGKKGIPKHGSKEAIGKLEK